MSEEWIQIAKWKPLDEIKVLSADGGTSLTFPEGNLLWIDTSDPEKHVLKMRVEISDEKRPELCPTCGKDLLCDDEFHYWETHGDD